MTLRPQTSFYPKIPPCLVNTNALSREATGSNPAFAYPQFLPYNFLCVVFMGLHIHASDESIVVRHEVTNPGFPYSDRGNRNGSEGRGQRDLEDSIRRALQAGSKNFCLFHSSECNFAVFLNYSGHQNRLWGFALYF